MDFLKQKLPKLGKKPLRGKGTVSPVAESHEGRDILAQYGFHTILLTTTFGLLPVSWDGSKLKYSRISFPTIYSVVFLGTMTYVSVIFTPVSNNVFVGQLKAPTATDMAVLVARLTYVLGFLSLVVRSQQMGREIPEIWDAVAEVVKESNLHRGDKKLTFRKLRKFCRSSLFFYMITMVLKEVDVLVFSTSDVISEIARRHPASGEGWRIWIVLLAYIIWNYTTLSHGLVSMVLSFFVVTLTISIRSLNNDFKQLLHCWKKNRSLNRIDIDGEMKRVQVIENCEHPTLAEVQQRINHMRKCYRMVEDTMGSLSSAFGTSILIEQVILTSVLTANSFFLFAAFFYTLRGCAYRQNDDFWENLSPILEMVAHSVLFFSLAFASTKIANESKEPLKILKEVPYGEGGSEFQTLLRDFKTDLQTTNIALTASDYSSINKGLVKKVLASVLTFALVFVQFQYQDPDADHCGDGNKTDSASFL